MKKAKLDTKTFVLFTMDGGWQVVKWLAIKE